MNNSNFIQKMFEQYGSPGQDSYGFINSSMLIVGAKLYSIDVKLFDPFDPFKCDNFMGMLRDYMESQEQEKQHLVDIGLQTLYFLLT